VNIDQYRTSLITPTPQPLLLLYPPYFLPYSFYTTPNHLRNITDLLPSFADRYTISFIYCGLFLPVFHPLWIPFGLLYPYGLTYIITDLDKQIDEGQEKSRKGPNLTSVTNTGNYIKFKTLEYKYFKLINDDLWE
jgi:hypothetical protein